MLAAGGIAACSDSSAPATLEGTYYMRLTDGLFPPVPYDPTVPSGVIRSVTAEFVAPDTLWITTEIAILSPSQSAALAPQGNRVYFRYTRSGDSLYNAEVPGPLGAVTGGALHLRISYPAPPSSGFPYYTHDYLLTK
jgi:hypothetical protein